MRKHVHFEPNTVPGLETHISIPCPYNIFIQNIQRAQNEHSAVVWPPQFRSRLNDTDIATAANATREH